MHGLAVGSALVAAFWLLPVSAAEPDLEPLIESYRADWGAPAVSVAIEQSGELVYAAGFGLADVENAVPATERTVYRIGSITKQFTAAAILLLVEDGRLSLETTLAELLPDYPTHGATITVAQLLDHTNGIVGYTEMPAFWAVARNDLNTEQMMALFGAEPLQFPPGERWQYSNSAYYLLGVIIEKLSGMTYSGFLRERIFAPLALADTWYLDNAPIVPRRAEGYERRDGELVNDDPLSMRLPYSAGSLGATVIDLIRWQRALRRYELISGKSYRRMVSPGYLNDGERLTYALGLAIGSLDGHAKISHGGGINGFRAQLAWYPDDDLAIAVLANSGSAEPGLLESRIARMLLGLPERQIQEIELTGAELALYAGNYDIGRYQLSIPLVDGVLRLRGERLRPVGNHVFHPEDDDHTTITFELNDDGAITGYTSEREGQTIRAARTGE